MNRLPQRALWWSACLAVAAAGQTPASTPPAFEVASVKPAVQPERGPIFCLVPCSPGERLTVTGTRVDIRWMPLRKLIVTAYRVKPYQVAGPDWMQSQRFDIVAKIPAGASPDQVPEMLQALLAERFKLAIHRETKDTPVVALVVGRNGPHLEPAAPDAEALAAKAMAAPGGRGMYSGQGEAHMDDSGHATSTGAPWGPVTATPPREGSPHFDLLAVSMAGLVDLLAPHEDRPVIDMTGLTGRYHIQVTMDLPAPPPPGADGGGGRVGRARSGSHGRSVGRRILQGSRQGRPEAGKAQRAGSHRGDRPPGKDAYRKLTGGASAPTARSIDSGPRTASAEKSRGVSRRGRTRVSPGLPRKSIPAARWNRGGRVRDLVPNDGPRQRCSITRGGGWTFVGGL